MPVSNVAHLEDLLALIDELDDVGRLAATLRVQIEHDIEEARRQEGHAERVARTKKRR